MEEISAQKNSQQFSVFHCFFFAQGSRAWLKMSRLLILPWLGILVEAGCTSELLRAEGGSYYRLIEVGFLVGNWRTESMAWGRLRWDVRGI